MDRSDLIRELMGTFLEELGELVQSMRVELAALAPVAAPLDEAGQLECYRSLYRTVHSLKGAARSVDQELVGSACQLLEARLPHPRQASAAADLGVDPGTVELLQRAVDAFVDAGRRIGAGEDVEEAETPLTRLVRELERTSSPRAANLQQTASAAVAPAEPATRATRPPSTAAAAPRHILVAEDSATVQALGKAILEAAGYRVRTASDGNEAWRVLEEHGADLLVSDVEMPGLDGLALIARIRSSVPFRDLPVVLLSSLDRPEDRARGLAVGADAYLVKGGGEGYLLSGELVAVIERLLLAPSVNRGG